MIEEEKVTEDKVEVNEPVSSTDKVSVVKKDPIVEAIHNDFDGAHAELAKILGDQKITASKSLQEARSDDDQIGLYKDLGEIGFGKSKTVSISRKIKDKISSALNLSSDLNKRIEAMEVIEKAFPGEKIISLKQLYLILAKYDLFISEHKDFIGEVPVANAQDIVDFHKKYKSMLTEDFRTTYRGEENPYFAVEKSKMNSYRSDKMDMPYAVVAPLKEFDTEGKVAIGNELVGITGPDMEKIKKELEARRKKFVEDPVVLLPVIIKDLVHFVIITKWGPEAELPEFK